jgi:hypothetical protein
MLPLTPASAGVTRRYIENSQYAGIILDLIGAGARVFLHPLSVGQVT